MSEYLKLSNKILEKREKENKQLELDLKKKEKKEDKKEKRPYNPNEGMKTSNPLEDSYIQEDNVDWQKLDGLKEHLRTILAASCDDIRISDAGGHRLNINGIIVRVEGSAKDQPGLGGVTLSK